MRCIKSLAQGRVCEKQSPVCHFCAGHNRTAAQCKDVSIVAGDTFTIALLTRHQITAYLAGRANLLHQLYDEFEVKVAAVEEACRANGIFLKAHRAEAFRLDDPSFTAGLNLYLAATSFNRDLYTIEKAMGGSGRHSSLRAMSGFSAGT
jgi:hypothetical protein